jgi:hypothetical protein
MSTILKTLKKLEQEKSVLEKGLDLKELVLQDEENIFLNSPSKTTRKIFLIGAIIFGGIAFGLFWTSKEKPSENQVARVSSSNTIHYKVPTPVKNQYATPVPGIPLSNIPEQEKSYQSPSIENKFYAIEKETPTYLEKINKTVKPLAVVIKDNPQKHKTHDVLEIQSLIATAKALANEPEEIHIPKINNSLSIPGLKVRGIIYFSPESSSNHILVSTLKSNNHKMHIGDSIDSATLMKIKSTGAVFAYKGQMVFLNIGH